MDCFDGVVERIAARAADLKPMEAKKAADLMMMMTKKKKKKKVMGREENGVGLKGC